MDEVDKDKDAEELRRLWSIDLDWYEQNRRSFSALVQHYMCSKCAKKLSTERKRASPNKLISTIKDCCSHEPGFITERVPLLESIFRLLLANGNQPLDLAEICRQLTERRGQSTYCNSAATMSRILENDTYYGLRPAKAS